MEAAGLQENLKFWQMHDMLFKNQRSLSPAFLLEAAVEIGLDMALFQASRAGKKLIQKVPSDFEGGVEIKKTTRSPA